MNEDFRFRLKELRANTGLSQQKFGMLFQIAAINISNWEQGITTPPDYVIYMLERLIEIDPKVPKKVKKAAQKVECNEQNSSNEENDLLDEIK